MAKTILKELLNIIKYINLFSSEKSLHFFKKKAAEEAHWARRRGLFGTLKALKSSFTKINLHTITPRAFSLCLRERHFFLCILRTLFDLLTISGRY